MVIKAEHTTFKKDFSVSGGDGPTRREMGVGDERVPESGVTPKATEAELPEGIEPNSLDELQFVMNMVAKYAGKGTPQGTETLKGVLLKSAAKASVEPNEVNLGAVLAAVVLLADEAGLSIDAVADSKVRSMATS